MSDLMKENLRMVKIDGVFQVIHMRMFEAESKKPNVRVYDDHGVPCLEHLTLEEIKAIEELNTPVLPTPVIEPSLQTPLISHQVNSNNKQSVNKLNPNYTGHRPKGLHYHYKEGKHIDLIPWEEIDKKIKAAYLDLEQRVYLVLTLFVGARKAEILELTVDSIKYNDTTLYVDVGKRLKGSESTKPIPIDRAMPYVDDIIALHTQRLDFRPTKKTIVRFGKIYTGIKKGKERIPVWSRVQRTEKWMFLNISRTTAINIFKKVLGSWAYPHYGRLWSLSSIARSHQGNLIMLKSRSGIKSTQVLNDYLGQSEEELNKSKDALTNIVGKAPNIAANNNHTSNTEESK
jgi:hypothetical protein